ncbi:MAG TPA: DNA internalization-related competence protein ComEC/Rec2, partial [Gammaproteobacteria bacterium]
LVVLGGTLLARPGRAVHSLALALVLVILSDSGAVLSPGFWLSFVAVAIIYMQQVRQPAARGLRGALYQVVRLQLALSLGLLPFTLLFFGQSGWVAPLANLFAVPWTSLLLVPLLFAALLCLYPLPWLAQWLFIAAGWAASWMLEVLRWLAQLPGAVVGMPEVPPAVTLAAMLGVALLLLPRGTPQRWLGALLVVPLLAWTAPRPAPGTAWFTLLDVGQGLAAVVQTARHTLVYDTGPRFSAGFDTGSAVVAPFLAARGIRRVDMLVVSHADNDHSGGARALDRLLPIHHVLTSVPQQMGWRRSRRCQAGQQWNWDGVTFRMLHPDAVAGVAENDASCVLQIRTADGTRLLLPGDVEAAAERRLVARYGMALRSEILVAPHHGSRTSSTPAFAAAVAPEYVLFPVGYRNRYGFPNPRVQERYRSLGSRLLATAETGAVQFRLGETRVPLPERARVRRYWDAAVPPAR